MSLERKIAQNIQPFTTNDEVCSQSTEGTQTSTMPPGWFVLRYRTHSGWLKNKLQDSPLEIFHKYRTIVVRRGKRIEKHELPVLHGYIFVHASFDEVRTFAMQLDLPLMKDPFKNHETCSPASQSKYNREEDKYIRISDRSMQSFIDASWRKERGMVLFDPNDVDVQHDDIVLFASGEFKGQMGYLKPGKGPNAGTVVLSLTSDDSPAEDSPTENSLEPHLPQGIICYAVKAFKDELEVVAFAPKSRHAKDCIINGKPLANEAFEQYKATGYVDDRLYEKLQGFVRYYGSARLNTNIQEAQHAIMLYRMYSILRYVPAKVAIRNKISQKVIPELVRRRDAALKRGNSSAAQKQSDLLSEIKDTDEVFSYQEQI